jgi:hypothetical protein
MKTVTLKSGQTYIEEEREGKTTLVPAHRWIEEQVAVDEIALAFELLAGKRGTEDFGAFIHWLLGELQEKYGDRWNRLFDAYLNSPRVGQLIARMDIEDILKEGGQSL